MSFEVIDRQDSLDEDFNTNDLLFTSDGVNSDVDCKKGQVCYVRKTTDAFSSVNGVQVKQEISFELVDKLRQVIQTTQE